MFSFFDFFKYKPINTSQSPEIIKLTDSINALYREQQNWRQNKKNPQKEQSDFIKYCDYNALILALQTYLDNYNKWSKDEALDFWCKEIRPQQLKLPVAFVKKWWLLDDPNGASRVFEYVDFINAIKRDLYEMKQLTSHLTESQNSGAEENYTLKNL